MKLANKVKPSVPQLEPGTYFGLCVGLYGIGEQEQGYNGKTRYVEQILMTFEIPAETVEVDGEQKPRHLSKTFTASTSEKGNLRKFLKSWRGKDFADDKEMAAFDLTKILGRSAMLNVVMSEKGYSNIDSIMPLPKGMADPDTSTPLMTFDVDEWDDDKFGSIPEWVQEKIKNSTQYKKMHAPTTEIDFPETDASPAQEDDDDKDGVPF